MKTGIYSSVNGDPADHDECDDVSEKLVMCGVPEFQGIITLGAEGNALNHP